MTEDDVRDLMRKQAEIAGSQKAWAAQIGVSQALVCQVINGHQPPCGKILEALGVKRMIHYEGVRPPIYSPALTDIAHAGVINDCRAEYERAEREKISLHDWAMKWGHPMIEELENTECAVCGHTL